MFRRRHPRLSRGRFAVGGEPVAAAGDTTPPTVSSLATDAAGTYIDVTLNEACDTGSTPAIGDFALGGTTQAVLTGGSVAWQSTTVLRVSLASSRRFLTGETITLSYTAGANPIQDAAGNDLANFSTQAVTNNSTERSDLVSITRFSSTTGNFPAQVLGAAVKWCWGAGQGGSQGVGSGACGDFAEDAAYVYAANEAWTVTIGIGGAVGRGAGGDTSIGASCVAKGGASAGTSVGTTIRAQLAGTDNTGTQAGTPSHGSTSAAVGTTPGEPNGAGATAIGASKTPGTGGRSAAATQVSGANGLAVLMYRQLAAANFPGLVGISITRSVGTSHSVTIPSGAVDNELVYIVVSDGNPTITITGAIDAMTPVSITNISLSALTRTATGSDPTTVTTSVSEAISVIVLRLNAAAAAEGTGAASSGANAGVTSHTPSGGDGDYRVITILARDASVNGNITGRPSGFDWSVFVPSIDGASSSTDCCVAWADQAVVGAAGSGNWTNANGTWITATLTMAKV